MFAGWLKSSMPGSLYGRAALILLVPVVVLQLLVSVVFIQRHYAGVTEQMTRNVAIELRYVLQIVEAAQDPANAMRNAADIAEPLRFKLDLPAVLPSQDALRWLDFSGNAMRDTMRAEIPQALRFDLTENRRVIVWLETDHGPMSATFDRRRVSASNPHQLLVLMVFAGLFLTVIAFVFLRNQLRPIRRLARASEAFGKGRRMDYWPAGASEVRAAGQAFIDMRERIERQIEQRTMMLSGVSHDLRTPITRLKLGLSMQEDSAEIAAMQRDVTDMERLVEEFLAFARGDTMEDPETVNVVDLVADVVKKFAATGEGVVLRDTKDQGSAVLHPMAIARALENLIGNAIKYGDRAEVSVDMQPGVVRILVEDDGPGIAAVHREDAVKPFVRLDLARNQDRGGGVGLGLAIANDIARRHGGDLELGESVALGGLCAVLTLAR